MLLGITVIGIGAPSHCRDRRPESILCAAVELRCWAYNQEVPDYDTHRFHHVFAPLAGCVSYHRC